MSTPSGPQDPTPESPSGPGESAQHLPPPPNVPNPGAPPQPGSYVQPAPGMPVYPQGYVPQPHGGVPYPGYPILPQQRPPDNTSKTLWIVLGVVGGVLLLACIACAGLVYVLGSQFANSSLFTAATFCSDEEAQHYHAAYQLLSANLKSQISETQFVQDNQSADTTYGPVTNCSPSATPQTTQPQASDTTQSLVLTVTRGSGAGSAGDTGSGGETTTSPSGPTPDGATTSGVIRLTKEGNSWKIDYIDQSLGLS